MAVLCAALLSLSLEQGPAILNICESLAQADLPGELFPMGHCSAQPAGTMEDVAFLWLGSAHSPGNMLCFPKTWALQMEQSCRHIQTFPRHLAVRSG